MYILTLILNSSCFQLKLNQRNLSMHWFRENEQRDHFLSKSGFLIITKHTSWFLVFSLDSFQGAREQLCYSVQKILV